jgi:hypothetical protein
MISHRPMSSLGSRCRHRQWVSRAFSEWSMLHKAPRKKIKREFARLLMEFSISAFGALDVLGLAR